MEQLPQPKAGMVVNYEYLWARQAGERQRHNCGDKIRPCAILAVVEGKDETTVYVSPITHTAPFFPEQSVELSPQTSYRIGLDEKPKWLMVNEVNKFTWPGDHLYQVGYRTGKYAYAGSLPEAVLLQAREKLKAFNANKALKLVARDAPARCPMMRAG